MVDVAARVAEEHEVAGQQLGARHRGAVRGGDLVVGHTRDLHAGLRVRPLHQTRAVEAGLRRRAAPAIRRAGVLLRLLERCERLRARALRHRGRSDLRRRVGWWRGGFGCGWWGGGGVEELVGLVELGLVAAAELFGGAFDVGDPFAVLVGVVDRLAAADALVFDGLGGVEEPVELFVGVVWVAGVFALVPDAQAHLEVADRVGVAEVEVLQPGFDQAGHHGQLRRQPAFLGFGAHPGGDLLARGVVAGVAGRLERGRRGRGDRLGRHGRGRGGGLRFGRDRLEKQVGVPGFGRAGGGGGELARLQRGEQARLLARIRRAGAAAGAAGAGAGAAAGAACTAAGAAGAPAANSAGNLKSGVIDCLKPTWMWF